MEQQQPGVVVLNASVGTQPDQHTYGNTLPQHLQAAMLRLTGRFVDEVRGLVDYRALTASEEFRQYVELARHLHSLDLTTLDEEEKLPFFINLYNALTMHAVATLQGHQAIGSPLDVPKFWTNHVYTIGSKMFSLDDIEHGILRRNRIHPTTGVSVMAQDDPRLAHAPATVEPRIHFALNCGAKSCPVVRVYRRGNVEAALEAATRSYLSQEVEVEGEVARLPKILLWYQNDFASDQRGVLRWILPYLEEEARHALAKLLALEDPAKPGVEYRYDWSLNANL